MSQSAIAMLAEVSDRIKASNDDVRNRVVNKLVERELDARATVLDKALDKLGELKKAQGKVRPDVETIDADGNKLPAVFSKAKFEEKKKADEKVTQLENALEKVISQGTSDDYNKLREVLQKVGGSGDSKSTDQ